MTGSSASRQNTPIQINSLTSNTTQHGNMTLVNRPQGVLMAWEATANVDVAETARYMGVNNLQHNITTDTATGETNSIAVVEFTHDEYEAYRRSPQGRALELPAQPPEKQGNTIGKITFVPPPSSNRAEYANPPESLPPEVQGEQPNEALQALINEAEDERSLWQRTKDGASSAWDGTKRVAQASWESPGEFGKGVLKGVGNLPSDLANLVVEGVKNGVGSPLSLNNYAKFLDYQAMQAYEAGNITSANMFAQQANGIREFGQVGNIFDLNNDAQQGGSFASVLIPLGTLVKAGAGAAKITKATKTLDSAADVNKAAHVGDAAKAPEPIGPNGNGGKIKFVKRKLQPGTPEHKADRWERYKSRNGKKTYEEWSKQYDINMRNYQHGYAREVEYRKAMGASEGTLKTPLSNRQIDILKSDEMYAGQLKTGPVSLTRENVLAIQKDAELVKRNWQVEHILEKGASKPYLDALKDAGIDVHIGTKIP